MRWLEFTEEEQLKGWHHVDLGEDGDFYADYLLEDNSWQLYGWWYPTEEAAEREGVDVEDSPFWSKLSFVPNEDLDDLEVASDCLAVPWLDWTISIIKEEP